MGKSLDKCSPPRKCIVTKDEIPDPQNLQLSCFVNGERRQYSNIADMVFFVAATIEDMSKHFTLEPRRPYFNRYIRRGCFGMKEKTG
jgi:2-keto-4-pentenoate hydratase/2-oxohepta-3-ene-1,7-dioic acid hydratase in catechol pathway